MVPGDNSNTSHLRRLNSKKNNHMNSTIVTLVILIALTWNVKAQGFIYDQQSSTTAANAGGGGILQGASPTGQSFTPTLTGLDFVQMAFYDNTVGNGLGASLLVNVRSGGITGTVLGTSEPIYMPDGFGRSTLNSEVATFLFMTSVGLQPGTVYYLEPVVQSGDLWGVSVWEYNYSGGDAFYQGTPSPAADFWFREGAIPEPSAFAIILLGAGVTAWMRRNKKGARQEA